MDDYLLVAKVGVALWLVLVISLSITLRGVGRMKYVRMEILWLITLASGIGTALTMAILAITKSLQ